MPASRLNPASTSTWLRPTLLVLLLVWIVLLPGNFLAMFLLDMGWLRGWWFLSSAVLALAAWAHWAANRGRPAGKFAWGIALGMTLGFLADGHGSLPRAWQLADNPRVILPLFALGHIAYIWACFHLSGRLGLRNRAVWMASLGVWILIGTVIWYMATTGAPRVGILRWPALAYTTLLSATAGTMTALALQDRRFTPMALGAMLFLASDTLLAIQLFHTDVPSIVGYGVWATYGPGQMLIVFGATTVSRRGATKEAVRIEAAPVRS